MRFLLALILILFGLVLKSSPTTVVHEYTIVGFAQGTSYSIKYYADTPILKNSIDSILEVIDRSMSIYRKDSKISEFNNPKTHQVKMDEHMEAVIAESFRVHKETDGYFDITVMPLVNLWGFGVREGQNDPTDLEVEKVHSSVGMRFLKKRGNYLKKRKRQVSIDVNGIAQGYTVDVLGSFLASKGIKNYIVELGGEILANGHKPHGDFVVEIQRPFTIKEKESFTIKLTNKAVTSSGSYERKKDYKGKIISHHIDPRTGYPIECNILSVTVIANSAMRADAIDNYLMALKPEDAISFVEGQKDLETYIIYVENNIVKELASKGFNNYLYR